MVISAMDIIMPVMMTGVMITTVTIRSAHVITTMPLGETNGEHHDGHPDALVKKSNSSPYIPVGVAQFPLQLPLDSFGCSQLPLNDFQ